jgi:hypothetical protein
VKIIKTIGLMRWLFVVLCAGSAIAQPPTPRHPGEKVSYIITFSGPGVGRLTGAQMAFRLTSGLHSDQTGFVTDMNGNAEKRLSDGVFEVSTTIGPEAATGRYELWQVSTGSQTVGATYQQGIPRVSITVENSAKFIKPVLTSIKEKP